MMKRKCAHSSAIIIHEWKKYRIALLLCTWACRQPYYMLTEGITSHEITAKEACAIMSRPTPAQADGASD